MTIVAARKVLVADSVSGSYFSRLRHIRDKITDKEAEIDGVVAEARKRSDRRVRGRGERLDAENGLEEALLELNELKIRSWATTQRFSKAKHLLRQEIQERRLDVLASSSPFVHKIEQALTISSSVHTGDGYESLATQTRWRSALITLMKEVSDSIDRHKQLTGEGIAIKDAEDELALAAASARLLSLHVNAWSRPQLLCELQRIWCQVVQAEAKQNPQFNSVIEAWQAATQNLECCRLEAKERSGIEEVEMGAVTRRVQDCRARAGVGPKAEKDGWWKQRNEGFLQQELTHINKKMAPLASPSHLASRYNILLAKCAETGAWETAVTAYQSMDERGSGRKDGKLNGKGAVKSGGKLNGTTSLFQMDPIIYHHLLRAAKNARPPQPRAAMLVLQEMRSRGEEPSATHYNLVLSACARAAEIAATTSVLTPLGSPSVRHEINMRRVTPRRDEEVAMPSDTGNFGGGSDDGNRRDRMDTVEGDSVAVEQPLMLSTANREAAGAVDNQENATSRPRRTAGCKSEARSHGPLSGNGNGTVLVCRHPETAGGSWRLAAEVVVDMHRRGVTPTEVTYKTLVESCRCAGAANSCAGGEKSSGGGGGDSAPADIFAALRDIGVPTRFCYDAGLENALRGGRCYPAYVTEMKR